MDHAPAVYGAGTLAELKRARKARQLVLVLGAGVSLPFKLTDWNTLIHSLFSDIFQTKNKKLIERLIAQCNSSAPLITRFLELESASRANFRIKLKRILYRDFKPSVSSPTMDGIIRAMNPKKTRPPVETVITYNFDNVLELQLRKKANNVQFDSVCSIETLNASRCAAKIHHAHGYIPYDDGDRLYLDSSCVFSEPEYHDSFFDPVHWANLIQTLYFSTHTCLFIGLSFTDPNLRRLLDLVKKIGGPENAARPRHYAIRKIADDSRHPKLSSALNYFVEKDLLSFGVNPVWVSSYEKDIPRILRAISAG